MKLPTKVKKAIAILEESNWLLCPKARKELHKLGVKINYPVLYCGNYVIKESFLCSRRRPKNAIPTIYLTPYNDIDQTRWMVQPIAKTITNKQWDGLARRKRLDSSLGVDYHAGNIGYYKRKLVAFDW